MQILESLETANPIVIRLRQLTRNIYNFQDIKKIEQFLLYDMSIKGFCNKVSFRKEKRKSFDKSE